MKRIIAFGISIVSIFILCSLSYQPIVANENTESTIVNEAVISTEMINMQTVINLLKRTAEDDNCGCEKEDVNIVDWDTPIICQILYFALIIGYFFIYRLNIHIIANIVDKIGRAFNCWDY
ncbi:MAG: hypothetical protein DRN27_07690 [Thermoplasmata archaeon]|nr:MAG: hypothetical protein DRN27_07690 [Thermoplasmata archaeon]